MLRILSIVSCVAAVAFGSAAVAGPVKAKSSKSQLQVSSQSLPIAGGFSGLGAGAVIGTIVVVAGLVTIISDNSSGSH